MSVECEMLGALLSERRRGELSAEQDESLTAHLAGCTRCREEAAPLASVLALVELPPVGAAEMEALRPRRVGSAPPHVPGRDWRLPAVLVGAAAAAVLMVTVRPGAQRRPEGAEAGAAESAERLPAGATQELFPELGSEGADRSVDTADADALSLEEPGLFGNLDG